MDVNSLIGIRIKELRTELGIKAEVVAQDLNMSKSAFSQLENGKTEFSVNRVIELADYFKVPVSSILPSSTSNVQINRDSSHSNIVTQINNADPSVKEMFQILLDKLGER